MYPNMFILLIAPPGVGKDQAIMPMRELWASTGMFNIAPVSMTHKGLIDMLADPSSQKQFVDKNANPPIWHSYHSLLLAVPELGVLLTEYNLGFLSALNELFNCWDLFEERIRSTGATLRIERPHIHLITGTQPQYLGQFLPETAFGMGFTARIIMVYAGEAVKVSLFNQTFLDKAMFKTLTEDLKSIGSLFGPFNFTPEARAAIEHWHGVGSEKDKPEHSKLMHYNTRRIMHILKLSMVFSASRSNEMIIDECDFQNALSTLREAESLMPEVFKDISSGGQLGELEEAFHFIMRLWMKTQKPVQEHRLVHFLSNRVPAYQIQHMISTMLKAGMIGVATDGQLNLPGADRLFIPQALNKHE